MKWRMYIKSKAEVLIFLILLCHPSFAQEFSKGQLNMYDSLTAKLKTDSIHIFRFQKFRPYVNIDQRYTFSKVAAINVNGLQAGVLIKEKHAVGLGAYGASSTSMQKIKRNNSEANRSLDMKYITAFYQYVAIDKRYIELDLQAEVGFGKYSITLTDVNTETPVFKRSGGIIVCGIGPMLAIKPFRWIGISGMAGYRFTFEKNTNLNFNGAYYSYGVWLDVRQIIRDSNYYLIKKRKYKKQLKEL